MNLEGVDLNLLLVLHHVLAEGGVTRAAERLHVTPSAVSNSMARLRAMLGDPLLVRKGRGLAPTPRAQELAPQIASALEALREALEVRARFRPEDCRRVFTIASADNIGILAAVTRRFARLLPHATLRIVSLDHAVASDALASGDADILLGLPPTMPREWRSAPAYSDRLVCGMSRENPAARRKLTLDRFLALRHIEVALQGKYPIDYVDGVLSGLGRTRAIALSVPLFTLAAMCVVDSPFITHLPSSMAKRMGTFLPITVRAPPFALPRITILQVWHQRTDADPASVLVRSIVREAGTFVERGAGPATR